MGATRRLGVSAGWLPGACVAATLVLQLGVITLVPAGVRPVASALMLVLWMAALCAVVLVVSRRRAHQRPNPAPRPDGVSTPEPDRQQPSARMQAAWQLARSGGKPPQDPPLG